MNYQVNQRSESVLIFAHMILKIKSDDYVIGQQTEIANNILEFVFTYLPKEINEKYLLFK